MTSSVRTPLRSPLRSWASNPYLLLTLTMVMWSANGIAGRLAIGEVSPMVIVTLRWLISCSLLFTFAFSRIREDWLVLKHHVVRLVLGAIFGFTGFNAIFYLAAHHTSAVNMTILQGALPIFVLMGAAIFSTHTAHIGTGAGHSFHLGRSHGGCEPRRSRCSARVQI